MYITAEFPANIDSKELYEMVKCFKLNVTDIGKTVYMYGEMSTKHLQTVIAICYKFGYEEITIKNPTG